MRAKRRLASLVLVMLLLFNLSVGVFAGEDAGTTRPKAARILPCQGDTCIITPNVDDPIVSTCGEDAGTTRPK